MEIEIEGEADCILENAARILERERGALRLRAFSEARAIGRQGRGHEVEERNGILQFIQNGRGIGDICEHFNAGQANALLD